MVGVCVMVAFVALMFKSTWSTIVVVAVWLLKAVRVMMVIIVAVILTCNVWMYKAVGWTPLSLLFGDDIYSPSIAYLESYHSTHAKE